MKKRAWNYGICHLSKEAKKSISEKAKLRLKTKGHPKGMLGKNHSNLEKFKKWKPTKKQILKMANKREKHPLWKGDRIKVKCSICKIEMECRPGRIKKYCSYECSGKSKVKEKNKCIDCGKSVAKKTIKRCRKCFIKYNKGEKCNTWKGGITNKNNILRGRTEYINWRKKIFKRDNYTCQKCGKHGVTIQAHHIKPFSDYPKLRLSLKNGVTLCILCHEKLHGVKIFVKKRVS